MVGVKEGYKYSVEMEDEKEKGKVWMDLSVCGIGKEKTNKIVKELEEAKKHIEEILAE